MMHPLIKRRWRKRTKTLPSWPPAGWSFRLETPVRHHEVGGVTTRLCSSCVISREDAVADGSLPATVHTSLGDALGSILLGILCILASEGEANTFRGILDWKAKDKVMMKKYKKHSITLKEAFAVTKTSFNAIIEMTIDNVPKDKAAKKKRWKPD